MGRLRARSFPFAAVIRRLAALLQPGCRRDIADKMTNGGAGGDEVARRRAPARAAGIPSQEINREREREGERERERERERGGERQRESYASGRLIIFYFVEERGRTRDAQKLRAARRRFIARPRSRQLIRGCELLGDFFLRRERLRRYARPLRGISPPAEYAALVPGRARERWSRDIPLFFVHAAA